NRSRKLAYTGGMSQRVTTRRFLHAVNGRGKLPSIVAVVVLCLWPLWASTCLCSAAGGRSPIVGERAGDAGTVVPCPSCCPISPQVDSGDDTCDPGQCPCEIRNQNLDRWKPTTTSPGSSPSSSLALDHVASLSMV